MKRVTATALATGAVVFALTGCGGSDNTNTDANGLRKGETGTNTSTPAATTTAARPTGAAPTSTDGAPTTTKAAVDTSSLGPASRTTCADFKKLDSTGEKTLIEQVLAENPDSPFEGSPNVALGTAKLVCLAPTYADTPVVIAAGIVEKNK
ncbi:hypothetical protein [Nocardia nepalensis]|uniref:hypothetical protein n=1 Tax=Nocardia nepalensis TaxID=3375448 RepID=UPI003B6843ED